jgi:DnaK suppressor protein
MFVSILQLMGFPVGKPVHSRAEENSAHSHTQPRIEGIKAVGVGATQQGVSKSKELHAQAQSARSKDVKASAGNSKQADKDIAQSAARYAAKDTVKVSAKLTDQGAAEGRPVAASKAPVKLMKAATGKSAAGKAAAKSPIKSAKPVPKAVVKPATKAGVKPVVKAAVKPSSKPQVKAPVKPAAKSVAKPVGKPTSKAPAKVAAKVAPKKAAPKVTPKLPPVTSGKAAPKTVPNPVIKTPTPNAAGQKPVSTSKPTSPQTPGATKTVNETALKTSTPVAKKPVATPVAAKPAAAPVAVAPPPPVVTAQSGIPIKSARPSSRLAQLTVPSMAQSIASTAAKSSFTQMVSAPLIVPPIPSAAKKDPKLANNWKTKPVEQMTDAELMAMPDSEYMNEKQMAVFRLKLSILKQDILNNAGETTEHLREDTVVVPDPADRATIEEEHALELRTRDRERKLLKKIEQSINRIDAGDYGFCDETGEPIGVGRLLARPTATLSLEAQQRRELKQKMFGD